MSNDKMREEFEAAMVSELNKEASPGEEVTAEEMRADRKGDSYRSHINGGAWWAWQASREALVIELPSTRWFGDDSDDYFNSECWEAEDVKEAIEDAGIRLVVSK